MKKLVVVLSVWLCLAITVKFSWEYYTSPVRIAEQITELDLPSNATPVSFSDDYSFLFGGGITCGELAVDDQQMMDLMKQADQKNYMLNLAFGEPKLLAVMQQSGCCQDTSIRFGNVPGRYKTLKEGIKESAYVLIDSLHRRVHFFRAIASPMF